MALSLGLALSTSAAVAQAEFKVAPVAEKKVPELPAGPLYWQIENFPTRAEAEAAASPLSLAREADGKTWLLTPGPKSAPTHGGTMVAEVGPQASMTPPAGNADPIAEVGLPEFIEERMFTLVGRAQVCQPGRTHRPTHRRLSA